VTEVRIIPLDRSLLRESAEVIARAFRHEAAFSHMLDLTTDVAVGRFARWLASQMTLGLRAGQPALVAVGPHGVLGVVVLKSPHVRVSPWLKARMAPGRLFRVLSLGRHLRFDNARAGGNDKGAEKPPEDLPSPYYTVDWLAVRPQAQGQGIGSLLLRAVADRADDDESVAGAYLNTSDPRTRAFYERHGYRLFRETHVGPVPVYHMFCDRAAPAGSAR
jgi:GNAT superfamily N-acetyltransferase